MYNVVALKTLILCDHHHHPSSELFPSCKTETQHQLKTTPHPNTTPIPHPLATTTLLSVPINLTNLGTSCKWGHIGFVLL